MDNIGKPRYGVKKAVIIFFILFSKTCFSQMNWDSLATVSMRDTDLRMYRENMVEIQELTILGLKKIKRDALISFHFSYAHYIDGLLKEAQYKLMTTPNIELDKIIWKEQMRKGEITRCEYNDLLLGDYEWKEIKNSYKHKK